MILKFLKKIFQSKITKRICCVFAVLLIGYLCFSVGADCFADGDTADVQTKMTNFSAIVSELLKGIYVLLWPLLYVCGIALDNSLVYGTRLHLDASLWSLWNIMKNIANFALGVLVLVSIVVNLFSLGKGKKFNPKDIIKNTVIAGVLIQMSWFLVAAIIDVSTILTYAIGGLPMTVLKTNPDYTNRPVMGINAIAGSDVNGMNINLYYTYGDHKISECEVIDGLAISGKYIAGPKYIYVNSETGFYLDTGYCALGSWPYRYNHVLSGNGNGIYPDVSGFSSTGNQINTDYKIQLKSNYENIQNLSGVINDGILIPIDASKIPASCTGCGALSFTGNDIFFTGQSQDGGLLYTVDNLIESSKGYVGPLITIYSSLLDVQSFVSITSENYVEFFISCFFKLIFFLILIVPIAGLAIVLICRVGILWLVIAASPILILCRVFKDLLKLESLFGKDLGGHLALGSLIKLIFAPVIVTFAISMSLIFVTAISSMRQDNLQSKEIMEEMGIEKEDNTYSVLGLVNIKLNSNIVSSVFDDFSYFITLLLSCGVIRFLLMAAIKLCGNVGAKIGETLSKKVGNLVENAPIVPIPGGNKTSIAAVKTIPDTLFDRKLMEPMRQANIENLEQSFQWLMNTQDKYADMASFAIEKVRMLKVKNPGITVQQIERQLTGMERTALINHYNSTNVNKVNNVEQVINNINTYYTNTDNSGFIKAGENANTFEDALNFTKQQLDNGLKNDPNWRSWAKGVVGSAVQVSNGMYVVDLVKGTETSGSPEYELITREEYELRHFGKSIEYATSEALNAAKQGLSESQQKEFDEYMKRWEKWSSKYKEVQDKKEKTGDDNAILSWFANNNNDDVVKWLVAKYKEEEKKKEPNTN